MGYGHGYHGHGCWGPEDCHGWGWGSGYGSGRGYGYGPGRGYGAGFGYRAGYGYGPGLEPGYGYRRYAAGRYAPASRSAAAAQLEAYLAALRDEVRAVEADLAELTGTEAERKGESGSAPEV